jgi:hypothetical protein
VGVDRLFLLFETKARYRPQSFIAPRTPAITDRQEQRQSVASSSFVLERLHNNSLAAKSERNVVLRKQEDCEHCTAESQQERTVALDTHRNLRISNTLFVHNSTANNNLPSHTANTAPHGKGPQSNTRIHTAYVISLEAPFNRLCTIQLHGFNTVFLKRHNDKERST